MKLIKKLRLMAIVSFAIILLTQTSCSKDDSPQTITNYPIQGLWEGTYTVSSPSVISYYFSFSIYPDGKLSYKSKGMGNYTTFADGTWTLSGTDFSFNVTTVNYVGGNPQHTQTGTATYSNTNGTLLNGTVTDPLGGSAVWTMTKVK